LLLLTVLSSLPAAAFPQTQPKPQAPAVEIVSNSGWPELRVDGKPFFVHAASFDYFRIPADLWPRCLDRYRELGINTIDLRIPWNWHEPGAGAYDFSGATNPRRDLRGLLHLITDRGFKLIVRAGPAIGDDWRSDGYPDWLLADSQFGMTATQIADGDEPQLEKNLRENAASAAAEWLGRPHYLAAVREWFAALGAELAPYDSHHRPVAATSVEDQPQNNSVHLPAETVSGPLIFIILENRPNLRAGADASSLSQYLAFLSDALFASGISAPVLIEPADLRISRASSLSVGFPDSAQDYLEGVSGGWTPISPGQDQQNPGRTDAASIALLLGTLREQPAMPPLITSFELNADAGEENVAAVMTDPSSVLLNTRMLFAGGARGITYSPLQDSITPAGYETPGSSRFVNHDSPIDLEGDTQPGAAAIERNGKLIAAWGEWLAGAHVHPDFGILDLRAAATDPGRATNLLKKLVLAAESAGWTPELVDPGSQSVDRLLFDPVIVVAVPSAAGDTLDLSKAERDTLIEYVERGGTLIFAPQFPTGGGLSQLWNAPGTAIAGAEELRASRHAYGQGAVIEWSSDPSILPVIDEPAETQESQSAAAQAMQVLTLLLERAGAKRGEVAVSDPNNPEKSTLPSSLLFSELVADNSSASPPGPPVTCNTRPLCAAALVSLTNLDPVTAADANLSVSVPPLNPQTEIGGNVVVHATVPAHDSLLLPLRASLCTTAVASDDCQDEIVYAGAELLGVDADDRTLELTFYAPVNATILLRLESQPEKIEIDGNELEGSWTEGVHLLTVTLPRGAAPDYLRVLKIHLHYKSRVQEKPNAPKRRQLLYDAVVVNGARLPLGRDASLLSSPALLFLREEKENTVILRTVNRGDFPIVLTARVDGPEHGSEYVRAGPGATDLTRIRLQAVDAPQAEGENRALVKGAVTLQGGGERTAIPLMFADQTSREPLHYQYDFERDGATDWILESDALRLIVCPRDGGRAVAIVSKVSGENMTTDTGALRDWFLPAGADRPQDFTFNRSYDAEWTGTAAMPGLRLKYHAPEAGPAGATIEKTLTLVSSDTFEVRYRVALDPAAGAQAVPGTQFVAASRVPATRANTDGTKICWPNAAATQSGQDSNQSGETCVVFGLKDASDGDHGGALHTLPSGVTHLEFQTPGSAGLRVEWTTGRMSLQMEAAGVLLQLALPAGDGAPAEAAVRYTVLPPP